MIGSHVLLSGVVGSTAYGLAHEGSDTDRLSKNRPIWIQPQIRGPEGAPMLDSSKLVNVLKR